MIYIYIYICGNVSGTCLIKLNFPSWATWGEIIHFVFISARPSWARLGPARPGSARLGSAPFDLGLVRLGSAPFGSARSGPARLVSVRLSPAWPGSAWLGVLGWSAVCGHIRSMRCRSAGVGQGSKKGELISPSTWFPRGGGLPEISRLHELFRLLISL